ncbi:MAG: linear amide C-N hydrolase [Cyanobacteria bacterium P01_D01_bin.14]
MCSIFSCVIDGQVIVGRNFDWIHTGGSLHFVPPTRRYGLITQGLCLIEKFGRDRPLEGMNAKGLFIGTTGVHTDNFPARPPTDTPLQLDELGIIRFVLERAATTRQATAIFNQVEIIPHNIEPYVRLQYFIVDQTGEFCIIAGEEQTDLTTLDANTFAAVTNFPLSLRDKVTCQRFEMLQQQTPRLVSQQAGLALLEAVSTELTIYSCVYSLTQKTLTLFIERDFQAALNFSLDKEIGQGHRSYDFGELRLMLPDYREQFKDAQYAVQQGFSIESAPSDRGQRPLCGEVCQGSG